MSQSDPSPTRVVGFDIFVTQFLDTAGQLRAPLPEFARRPESLRELYATMVEARIFDKKATALQRAGQLGGYAPRLGFESIGTAIGSALCSDDIVLPSHREPAMQLWRGAAMHELFAYWSDPQAETATLVQAHTLAMLELRGSGRIVLVSCDDQFGADSRFEELLLAATHANLPVVVVAANIVRTPAMLARRRGAPLARRALAAGIHAEAVDGNDVIASRDVIEQAADRARRGGGPTFVEAPTWQLHDGSASGHAPRSDDEIRTAWEHCPIKRLKRYIDGQSLWSIEQEETLLMSAGEAAEAAARSFLGSRSGAR